MPAKILKEFLDNNSIEYTTLLHSPAFTAQHTAERAHVPGRNLAKTVMVKVDGKMAMAILPAPKKIDFGQFRYAAGTVDVELAGEREFEALFPDCEIGAMPPFGNLYGMSVFVTDTLCQDAEIAFNAGTHKELIKLRYQDFEKLVKPTVDHFDS